MSMSNAEKDEKETVVADAPAVGDAPVDAAGQEAPALEDLAFEKAKLEQEVAHLKDQVLRAVAETENVRKRAQRDQEETSKYAVTGFAREMVNVVENLQRASQSIPEDQRGSNELLKTLGEGVDMTMRELLAIFARHGIVRIDPKGEKFDHNFHQAVSQVEDPAAAPGTVVQVFQAGYVIHDRLLRPAMVSVARQGDPEKKLDTQA